MRNERNTLKTLTRTALAVALVVLFAAGAVAARPVTATAARVQRVAATR